MDIDEKIALVLRKPTEEVLTLERLRQYLEQDIKIRHYIGFEVSGFVHLGTGIMCMSKVADFQQAGFETIIFLADLHAWINRKLGGDLETIRKVAGGYFKEAMKLSLKTVGGDPEKVKIILGSKLYEKLGLEYLEDVIRVSINTTLARVRRSITIMGRKMGEAVSFAQLLYVPMQVADIFALKVNLAHGGVDQRKAHVIALDVGKEFEYIPIAVHHHLILGLHITEDQRKKLLEARKAGNRELFEEGILDVKMSKSKPETCIFIHDSEEEIKRKIKKAYCPWGEVELNPVWEIFEYIIYPWLERTGRSDEGIEIINKKTGERKVFETFNQIKEAWIRKEIHPLDLKEFVAEKLIEMLEPVRKYFLEGPGKKYLEEMKSIKITR